MKKITVGRSSQCDIILNDGNISRIHAEIICNNGQYVYSDISRNGSNIGGRIVMNQKVVLAPGTPVLLANRVPLPWDLVYTLLPLSGVRADAGETNYGGCVPPPPPAYAPVAPPPPPPAPGNYYSSRKDELAIGWGIGSFIFPLLGLILYFAWKGETPRRARQALNWGIAGFATQFIIGFMSGLAGAI